MNIIDMCIDGNITWEEIWTRNIAVMNNQIVRERNNKHDPDDCSRKVCSHGGSREIAALTNHRDQLVKELQVIRAGVAPTDVR